MTLLLGFLLAIGLMAAAGTLLFKHVFFPKPKQIDVDEVSDYDLAVYSKHPSVNIHLYRPFYTIFASLVVAIGAYAFVNVRDYDEVMGLAAADTEEVFESTLNEDPPPPELPPEPKKTIQPKKIEAVEDLIDEEELPQLDSLDASGDYEDEDEDEDEGDEEETYTPPTVGRAEVPAEFPGGKGAFRNFIVSHYNAEGCPDAIARKVKGVIRVNFTVNTTGRVANVGVDRGIEPCLDKEAVRVISSSPDWSIPKVQGRAVIEKHKFPVVIKYD